MQVRDELKIGDVETDGRAVEASWTASTLVSSRVCVNSALNRSGAPHTT
jgi:hypothetical protein